MILLQNSGLIVIPFLVQGLAIFVDEFYFHIKRGLPTWEKLGHPLDSLSVLVVYVFILNFAPSNTNFWIYLGLSSFSCVFVTKDEFVHKDLCSKYELWLHAVLFLLHPIVLALAGFIWFFHQSQPAESFLWSILKIQAAVTGVFMFYQLLYWNLNWKRST